MKKITICSLSLLTLLTAMLIFSCTPAPQNTNLTQTTNTPAAANITNSAEVTPLDDDEPCTATTIGARLTAVDTSLKRWIKKKDSLKYQYPDIFNFTLRISPSGDSIYMYIDGALGGKDQTGDLASIIKKVMNKNKACVQRVIFLRSGTLKSGIALTEDMGFEWFNCDDPKVPCPGGKCLDSCDAGNSNTGPGPKPAATANSNAAPSSNSNQGNTNR